MAYKAFKQIRVPPNSTPTSKQVNELQSNVADAINQLLGKDQLDTMFISNIVLQPAPIINKVPHLLGRNLKGYQVVRCHGGFPLIYEIQDTNPSPNLLIYLISATTITVDLLVF
jgi:hypothetical protein